MRQVPDRTEPAPYSGGGSAKTTGRPHAGARTLNDFQRMKDEGVRLSMVTCYDAWSARLLARSSVDALLVGDSVSMVMHGHPSTVHADLEMMRLHTAAVRRGDPEAFVVADMPFPLHRLGPARAMEAVDVLAKAGATAVKIEGARGHLDTVEHIVESGFPVMGHLGLTPQSVHQLGGYRVQGRDEAAAEQIFEDSQALEAAGCFALVLECVPKALAERISRALRIPTIGIGSGPGCDGQILVLHDMLGMNPGFKPRFLRTFLDGAGAVTGAVDAYAEAVRAGDFPNKRESFL
ncbi:MAG: 3-methyl-2-oxobutanoate hydroxymethyltransferase [Opitutales bacterium]|nr:3-methyl-2-oxobutanoate hydroxymethyltransferase [Opitutales bacterium]